MSHVPSQLALFMFVICWIVWQPLVKIQRHTEDWPKRKFESVSNRSTTTTVTVQLLAKILVSYLNWTKQLKTVNNGALQATSNSRPVNSGNGRKTNDYSTKTTLVKIQRQWCDLIDDPTTHNIRAVEFQTKENQSNFIRKPFEFQTKTGKQRENSYTTTGPIVLYLLRHDDRCGWCRNIRTNKLIISCWWQ